MSGPVGNFTLSIPFALVTSLVTRTQTDEGTRLVVEYKLQLAAQAGQLNVNASPVTEDIVKLGATAVTVALAEAVERPSETVSVTG